MLKTPITLPIAPSRQWQLTQCCLLTGVVALSYWIGGSFFAAAAVVVGGTQVWRDFLRQPQGVLTLTATASLLHGRWLSEHQAEEYPVSCDYLGPWLIGLYVGKQRVWLWPDSAPKERLRDVRKLFHRPGQ